MGADEFAIAGFSPEPVFERIATEISEKGYSIQPNAIDGSLAESL